MIRNIVLDIGNVLAAFDWQGVLARLGLKGADFEAVAEATVRASAWRELDRGVLPDEDIIRACIRNAPGYETEIRSVFEHLDEMAVDYDYARAWIASLKERGFGVYILSNFGKTSYTGCRARGNLGFVEEADGALISYEVGFVKLEREIYEAFTQKFHLDAETCLFFDDSPINVVGARACGWRAEVFESYAGACRRIMEPCVSGDARRASSCKKLPLIPLR